MSCDLPCGKTPRSKSSNPSMGLPGCQLPVARSLATGNWQRATALHLSTPMLKARDIGAYRDLLVLFTRYGRKDFRLSLKPDDLMALDEGDGEIEPDVQRRAQAFANRLQQMGATYVKFGQVVSTRPDIVPPEYIAALESLQDHVEPFSYAEVEAIVQQELGARISKLFETFESTPMAAASLGQVHRGV